MEQAILCVQAVGSGEIEIAELMYRLVVGVKLLLVLTILAKGLILFYLRDYFFTSYLFPTKRM